MSIQTNALNETQLEVRNIIYELEENSANGDYIYRGEPEHYGKISSNLYRQYAEIEVDGFDIEIVQEEILTEAEAYSHETDNPLEILTQIQHYGGQTNLIDFTTDYLVALFFACDSSEAIKKDGRIILLHKTKELTNWIEIPRNPRNRVIAQKSVFVQHPKGFFNPDDLIIINIPTHLKLHLLEHLRKYHGISTNTIYNDLHGFITNQSIHESAYTELHRGLSYYIKGDEAENPKEKQEAYEKAVHYYTKALELKPDLPEGYNNRGNAYREKGEIDKAIQDYNNAIKYEENDAVSYNNRGNA
ncbi:tetratricopeptide repeat protein, partial [Candidatus Poribacteria bacterium]|nr:tetratricopeptide repeat protein [Candidatus Poribacteria bacterium]